MMLEIIASQPDFLIIIEFIVFSILIALGGHRLLRPAINSYFNLNSSFGSASNDSIRAAFVTIIAFSIATSLSNYNNILKIIDTEASQLNKLDQLLIRYAGKDSNLIRQNLLEYTESIVKDEWNQLSSGNRSEITQGKWMALSRSIVKMSSSNDRESSLVNEIIKNFESITESRDSRVGSARLKIPAFFGLLIGVLFLVKILLFSCYEGNKEQNLSLTLEIMAFWPLIGVIFILNYPYSQSTRISSEPIQETIQFIKSR